MLNPEAKKFADAQGWLPRFQPVLNQKHELVLGGMKTYEGSNYQTGKPELAMKLIVRDKKDGEIKEWLTKSRKIIMTIGECEKGQIFIIKQVQKGAKKTYEVDLKGSATDDEHIDDDTVSKAVNEPEIEEGEEE